MNIVVTPPAPFFSLVVVVDIQFQGEIVMLLLNEFIINKKHIQSTTDEIMLERTDNKEIMYWEFQGCRSLNR